MLNVQCLLNVQANNDNDESFSEADDTSIATQSESLATAPSSRKPSSASIADDTKPPKTQTIKDKTPTPTKLVREGVKILCKKLLHGPTCRVLFQRLIP